MDRAAKRSAAYFRDRKAANPDYQPRQLTRGPAVWDETALTEKWTDYRARKAAERGRPSH